jgi:hypothetical protein
MCINLPEFYELKVHIPDFQFHKGTESIQQTI